ncbi:MAG: efflux RND transporter periplasmic adaptor subunit [Alicyclobacillus sp.]|nr:efflux RND transporter periplasmic adaptor subunit [Alicyclobacillus sp.]
MARPLLHRRWLIGGVILGVAVVLALVWVFHPRAQRVQTTTVKVQSIQEKIYASGTVRPRARQVVMPGALSVPLDHLAVQVGQRVQKGQVLVVGRNAAQAAAVTAAQSAVTQARAALAAAQQSTSPLVPPILAGQPSTQQALAQAQANLAQAEANLAQAQAAYDATVVRAQLAGTVVLANPDGVDNNGNAAPWVEVVSDGKQVVTQVSEVDAVHVAPGMSAQVTSEAYPNQTWSAVVSAKALFAAQTQAGQNGGGQVEVDLKVPSDFPVPLGFQVDVHIVSAAHAHALVIPYQSLTPQGNGYAVFVVNQGRALLRPVTIGITTDTWVEVTRGLQAGDVVVVNPPSTLQNGAAVKVS